MEQQVPVVQGATGFQEQPKRQRSPRKKKNSEWTLNQKQFDHSKTQEISHILPGEQLNMFNGEESVSYLQLPAKKKEENHFCTRCGEMGHGRRYCHVNTWCKFCVMDTHAMRACRKYEKFVKDNPIASSRRNTPVQVQGQRADVNPQERPQQPLFQHPPVQRYYPMVIPQKTMHNLTPQDEERESREHSRKSPQNQMKEIRTPVLKQFPHQRSSQDVRMDPRYQKPPQYAEINYHRPSPQTPVEVKEIGPTIQQGVIQHPVQRHSQTAGERPRGTTVPVNAQQTMSVPSFQINVNGGACEKDRKRESDLEENDYVINCIHESRPFTVNDVGRPVFVNHYYAGEVFIPITNKKLIKLDECDVIVNYNQRYQNLVERVEGWQLDSIRSTVAMELYLGSIIEPIRKSIRNTLYLNSKHVPKTLGEAMQKAQDLHIKHLYAIGEDQDSVISNSDVLPKITVNEVTSREDRGWYKNKCDFREHSQNSREISPQRREYSKKVTFNQPSGKRTANNSEYTDSSRNLRVSNNYSKEHENNKSNQQPSVIRGSFMQIMVNPMQLQDHEFTAWLDRLVEARKNR